MNVPAPTRLAVLLLLTLIVPALPADEAAPRVPTVEDIS